MSCGCVGISHAYVIFGATGNLAVHKLLPALYQLHGMGHLADDVEILGCGRTPFTPASWQAEVRQQLVAQGMAEDGVLESFIQRLDYLAGSLTEATFYQALGAWIQNDGDCANNVIFYLSVSPALYVTVTEGLAAAQLLDEVHGFRRMVIEKPFGHDLASARALQHSLSDHLNVGAYGIRPLSPLTVAVFDAPKPPPERVSLSVAALQACRQQLVLVTGAGKGDALAQWREGKLLPIAVAVREDACLLVDAAAYGE